MDEALQLFSLLAVLFESHRNASLYPSLKTEGNSVEIANIAVHLCILHINRTRNAACVWCFTFRADYYNQ